MCAPCEICQTHRVKAYESNSSSIDLTVSLDNTIDHCVCWCKPARCMLLSRVLDNQCNLRVYYNGILLSSQFGFVFHDHVIGSHDDVNLKSVSLSFSNWWPKASNKIHSNDWESLSCIPVSQRINPWYRTQTWVCEYGGRSLINLPTISQLLDLWNLLGIVLETPKEQGSELSVHEQLVTVPWQY